MRSRVSKNPALRLLVGLKSTLSQQVYKCLSSGTIDLHFLLQNQAFCKLTFYRKISLGNNWCLGRFVCTLVQFYTVGTVRFCMLLYIELVHFRLRLHIALVRFCMRFQSGLVRFWTQWHILLHKPYVYAPVCKSHKTPEGWFRSA